MPTIHQLIKKPRFKKKIQTKSPALEGSPQKKGVCLRLGTRDPKKPNSAKRKVANLLLTNQHKTIGFIPGEGHNLQEHAIVLIRGGRAKDLPGVKYQLVGGVLDFKNTNSTSNSSKRKRKRSKYGVKRS